MVAPMSLQQLLQGILPISGHADVLIQNIVSDSREVTPGSLFIALPGLRQDGRAFVDSALTRGAVAVIEQGSGQQVRVEAGVVRIRATDVRALMGRVAQRFFADASRQLSLIGVTGTNGKSSVTHFIAQMLSAAGRACAVIGTLGNGFPGALRETTHTTPDALRLHREMTEFLAAGAQAVAMEVSSHALHQERVAGLHFTGAVFTNLTRDHLDYHGDMQRYGEAKQRLFERAELKFAIINRDDPFGRQLATATAERTQVLTYAIEDDSADLWASEISFGGHGIRARVHYLQQSGTLSCRLIGDFNLSNLLAAIGVLISLGLPLEVVLKCAENLQPVAGRMQVVQGVQAADSALRPAPLVIVDYAHTPDALDQALRACALHLPSRIWCVFGCGGDRDRGKRPLMATVAASHGARLVVTDDNPRTESPEQIVQDILNGVPAGADVRVLHAREQAIAWAIGEAAPTDIVLIAGKGHEPYQEINGVRHEFNDAVVAQRCLASRSGQGVSA